MPHAEDPVPTAHPTLEGLATARRARRLLSMLGPFIGLLLVIVLFGSLEPESFLSSYNLKTVLVQTVIVAMGALGMTYIIISGGIDLSVGSVIALVTVVTALLLDAGAAPVLAVAGGVITGGLCGLANGLLITTLRIVPFIVTLGMLGIARGLAKYLAGEQKVDAPAAWLPDLMMKTPEPRWLLLAPGVWMLLLLAAATAVVLRRTRFGVHTVALGSNEATARLCGVRVGRVKVMVYTLAGLLTGLAGVMQFSRLTVGDPTTAVGMELDVIAAVVIGGGSLAGGEGSIVGSLVGAFIMSLLANGCNLTGVPNYVQEIIIGAIIIAAVAIDRLRHGKK